MIGKAIIAIITGSLIGFTGLPGWANTILIILNIVLVFVNDIFPGVEAIATIPFAIIATFQIPNMTPIGLVIYIIMMIALAIWWVIVGAGEIAILFRIGKQ